MPVVIERLPLVPVPVDLRLCVWEVTMGWKTVGQVQAEMLAKPDSLVARRVQALSLVPAVVGELGESLLADHAGHLVLFTCFRAVIEAVQERVTTEFTPSVYRGTPEKKKEKALKKWRTTAPFLLVHLNKTDWTLDLSAATEAIFIDESPQPEENAHVLSWLRPDIRVRVCEAAS